MASGSVTSRLAGGLVVIRQKTLIASLALLLLPPGVTCVYHADVERLRCLAEADGLLDRMECHGERLVHWVLCGVMYPNCYMVENPCLYESD